MEHFIDNAQVIFHRWPWDGSLSWLAGRGRLAEVDWKSFFVSISTWTIFASSSHEIQVAFTFTAYQMIAVNDSQVSSIGPPVTRTKKLEYRLSSSLAHVLLIALDLPFTPNLSVRWISGFKKTS